ncbi:MAG: O-antigen ligase family protein [Verrucomicrobiales bacterium]
MATPSPIKTKHQSSPLAEATKLDPKEKAFQFGLGTLLGLALLKFGNPTVLEKLITAPQSKDEILYQPWPVKWGYLLCFAVLILSGTCLKARHLKWSWFLAFPLVWFGWQLVSASRTIDHELTSVTLAHFLFNLLFFFVGYFVFRHQRLSWWFIAPLGLFYCYVMMGGFGQHYGGLEAMRKQFYETPNWQLYSSDYMKKLASNRIFSTLVYPNALAGAILMLLPILGVALYQWGQRWQRTLYGVAIGTLAYTSLACLYWTESRGGWLVAMSMIGFALLHLPMPKKRRIIIVSLVLLLGITAFSVRFSGYFKRGATSVSARFIYWQGAVKNFQANPVFGVGPGAFGPAFSKVKPPDAEMARLTHNDYLEQASDSGIIGAVAYFIFIWGVFWRSYRKIWGGIDLLPKAIWLGTFGWAAQNFIEFGLYIPALAWPAFLFLGWLLPVETAPPKAGTA